MTSLTSDDKRKEYSTGYICPEDYPATKQSDHEKLDSDPPLELLGIANDFFYGFKSKNSNGIVNLWGHDTGFDNYGNFWTGW